MRQRLFQPSCAAASLLALTACSTANRHRNPALKHHTPEGFANNYAAGVNKPFGEFVRWQAERNQQDLPKLAKQPTPVQTPDMAAISAYANHAVAAQPTIPSRPLAITWIGHASMLVQACGPTVLTDPMFSERVNFAEVRTRFASRQLANNGSVFDLALLPIGACKPRWFMAEQHIGPLEAVQIHIDLKAKRSVGIHWGVFELTDELLDQPPQDLADATKLHQIRADEFTVMAIGETRLLPSRTKP